MSLSAKLRRAPLRVVTGAFIVTSGLGKLKADEETATALHGLAAGTYPFLGSVNPKLFTKGLAAGELAVGGALLAPFVSPVVAGAGLVGFSGALLNMYWQTPGMHEPGDPRPTQQGLPIAKDVWMLGIGTGLIVDGVLEPAHDKKVAVGAALVEKRNATSRRARRKARRAAKKAGARAAALAGRNEALTQRLAESTQAWEKDARRRAQKAGKAATKAQKTARRKAHEQAAAVRADLVPVAEQAADTVRSSVRDLVEEYGPRVEKRTRKARKEAASRATSAREAIKDAADQYGPAAADRAKAAREAIKDAADEYGPALRKRAEEARAAAVEAAREASDRVHAVQSAVR